MLKVNEDYRLSFGFRYILLAKEMFCMAKDEFFIERRDQGDYAIRRPNSERASGVERTQSEAIDRARKINPDATIHVERVKNTDRGTRDRWRRP
jgi:hypothetical protein